MFTEIHSLNWDIIGAIRSVRWHGQKDLKKKRKKENRKESAFLFDPASTRQTQMFSLLLDLPSSPDVFWLSGNHRCPPRGAYLDGGSQPPPTWQSPTSRQASSSHNLSRACPWCLWAGREGAVQCSLCVQLASCYWISACGRGRRWAISTLSELLTPL